ncbi:MAG TPA: DNA polymerase IV [Quisquiliibacterium sp.]|nr:DNA polymerase IV [Quisquiliibacterium sp.]HPA91308.1 DNA polymerase IV [Quisquiliibacterium sp.]HQN14503.1 DNA polymerase IV [Quisquiliibacterium sp.]HQP66091.1 DNA polymerase IV [Quisquiliibacterium sp.]
MRRRIAHLDMDAFYASVELLRRPDLIGRPVAIGGRGEPNSRGVVTTATYAARAFGIRSGMALRKAAELCPECVFLPVDFDEYRRYSRMFKAAVATVTDRIEDRGIDEVYLDLSAVPGIEEDNGAVVAREIKRRVTDATGLTCSIGLAPNKLLAKISSDLDKPDGLAIVDEADIPTRIWPLPARRINGIGPKADARLEALGIRTIGELAAADPQWLMAQFTPRYGQWLHDAAHGRDERPIVTESEPVSRSRETTFERDLHLKRDWHALAALLADLCRRVAHDLSSRGYVGRTIGVKVRYDDFRIVTRDVSIAHPTSAPDAIRRAAFEALSRVPTERRLRLIGVRVAALSRAGAAPDLDTGAPHDQTPDAHTDAGRTGRVTRVGGAGPNAPEPAATRLEVQENLRLFD